jgi:hypothetical protein
MTSQYERHKQTIGRYEVFLRGDQADVIMQSGDIVSNMTAAEALGFLNWLATRKDELYQAAQADEQHLQSDADLEAVYGPAASHSDHKRGEHITYRPAEGGPNRTGTILWVQAAGKVGDHEMGIRYVIDPDEDTGFLDIAMPGDVVEPTE